MPQKSGPSRTYQDVLSGVGLGRIDHAPVHPDLQVAFGTPLGGPTDISFAEPPPMSNLEPTMAQVNSWWTPMSYATRISPAPGGHYESMAYTRWQLAERQRQIAALSQWLANQSGGR